MTQLPPPNRSSQPSAPGGAPKHLGKLPEAVRLMVLTLSAMLTAELIHQFLTAAAVLIDPSALRESARDAARGSAEQISDAMITMTVYSSVALMLVFQVAVVGLLAFAVRAVARQSAWSSRALRLLQFFALFFSLRMLALFIMTPDSATVPVALYAVDGVVQILAGVAGVVAFLYSMQDDVQKYARQPDSRGPRHDEQGR
ncbi:hypothetical protein [Corynebacterium sp. LK2510]|uniref:hypothetical protein n=1 Tax=Corynebacterium sp. LK2510 TaxID=3110472 RepID=UPI0034CD3626